MELFTFEVFAVIWICNLDSMMFVAGTLTQEQDIIKPNCVQKTIWCFITRLPLVKQVLNLRLLQFRWFVGILSLQLKLRDTSMYERESGSYSLTFWYRTTSTSIAYTFLPSIKHLQVTLDLFSLRFFSVSDNFWWLRLSGPVYIEVGDLRYVHIISYFTLITFTW